MQRIGQSVGKSILCLVDEAGSLSVASPEPGQWFGVVWGQIFILDFGFGIW